MLTQRMYQKDDYDKIMSFLKEMYANNKNQHCWLPSRWEYAEHLVNPLYMTRNQPNWEDYIKIWEENEKIVAITHIEDTYNAFLQVRPGYGNLEPEMIAWAEDNLAREVEDGGEKKLVIWVNESDRYRQGLLQDRGFHKGDVCSYLNRQDLSGDFEPDLSPEYQVRSVADGIDLLQKYNMTHQAFHPEEGVFTKLPSYIVKMTQAPMYDVHLDLAIQDQAGGLAAACTIWFDQENKIGMFEPVATHPAYQRQGLGRALLRAGLTRLKNRGAEQAYVEAYGEKRCAFYASAGFEAYDRDYPWIKSFNN